MMTKRFKFHQYGNFILSQNQIWWTAIHFLPSNSVLFSQDTCSIFLADLFIQYIFIFGNIWQYDIEMRKRTIDNQPGHCKNAVITFVPHHFFLHAKSMYVIFYFHEIASIVGPFFDRTLCISRNLFIWNPWAAAAVQYILLNLFNICEELRLVSIWSLRSLRSLPKLQKKLSDPYDYQFNSIWSLRSSK